MKQVIVKLKKKKKVKSKYKPDNTKILVKTLFVLVQELLPSAVKDFKGAKTANKRNTAYTVTNIISEIRQCISQLDGLIDTTRVKNEINGIVALVLRNFLEKISSHLDSTKESMRIKTTDSAVVKQIEMLLDGITTEFQKELSNMAAEIDVQVTNSINEILSPPKKRKAKKKKKSRR